MFVTLDFMEVGALFIDLMVTKLNNYFSSQREVLIFLLLGKFNIEL